MADDSHHQRKTKAQLIETIERLERQLSEQQIAEPVERPDASGTGPLDPVPGISARTSIKTLVEALNRVEDGVVLYDPDDRLIFCNRAYVETAPADLAHVFTPGTKFEDIVRAHVYAGQIQEAAGREEDYIQDRLQRHQETRGLPPHQFADGTWFTTTEYALANGGRLLVRRDVSEWMAMTRQLSENEERFRDFAEASQDWFWEMDEDLRFCYFSDRFYWASGVRPEQLLGRTRRETLWDNPDEEPWKSHIADLEAHRPFRDFVHPRRRADGEVNYLSISGKPVFGRDGRFLGYRGTGRNITSQWRAEMDLARAKEEAEMASQAKTNFLANMSHELRTPLNSIIGYSEVIVGETFGPVENEKYAEYVELIKRSGRHLLELIDDILDVSIIESGQAKIDQVPFDLNKHLLEAVDLMQEHADASGISLQHKLENVPNFIGDERRIRQSVLNLLSNAIKFTDAGGRVLIEVNRTAKGGVQIRISDTGIGIDPKDQDMVMSAFGQTENAFTRSHKGAGLGLPIVKTLTELHDGELHMTSLPGQGTAITMRFPKERLELQDNVPRSDA